MLFQAPRQSTGTETYSLCQMELGKLSVLVKLPCTFLFLIAMEDLVGSLADSNRLQLLPTFFLALLLSFSQLQMELRFKHDKTSTQ